MSRRYGPSASTLVWGVGALVVGVVVATWAWLAQVRDAAYGESSDAAETLVVLGGFAAVVGLCVALTGLWQLATNVDIAALAAQEAAARVEREIEHAERAQAEVARESGERWKGRLAQAAGRDSDEAPDPARP